MRSKFLILTEKLVEGKMAKWTTYRLVVFCFLIFLMVQSGYSQNVKSLEYFLPQEFNYDSKIPTPEDYFGFQPGEWHIRHDQLVGYLKTLASVSNRLIIEEYGRTYEQRPLLLLIISSPENLKNINKIKEQHRALCDPDVSANIPLGNMPVVVWMGYSVHGNEASGCNAAPLVGYFLAAAQGNEIEALLKNTIILLDPCINPDGYSRFSLWVNMHRGKVPVSDPNHREQGEAWPYGRTNHYWFDLNRDWLLAQHPETKGRLAKFYEWRPNVLTDHHEMGTNSTFFFQPGVLSRNHPLIPMQTYQLTEKIAQFHARALDQIGSLYYHKETYDDFYFGKGSTYPDLNGGIGILFEQASVRGHIQQSVNGLLTFPFAIRNQFVTSLSTLRAATALRVELLNHQRDFYLSAVQQAQNSPITAYVFGSKTDPARAYHLLEVLRTHQINVFRLASKVKIDQKEFEPEWSWIVPVQQPQFRLISALFERRVDFQDSIFYDVSTWTFPLAFNMPFAELKKSVKGLLGDRVLDPVFPTGKIVKNENPCAYVFSWEGYYAPRAVYRLLKSDIRIKVAMRDFTAKIEGKEKLFRRGTILIPLGIQKSKKNKIDSLLKKIIMEDAVDVFALPSGLSFSGIDLGSPALRPLKKPQILLVTGAGLSISQIGEAWHLLDHRMDMEVSLVEKSLINSIDLDKYNVMVLVSGQYDEIDSSGMNALNRWVRKGNTLILFGNSVRWAKNNKLIHVDWIKEKEEEKKNQVARRPYALRRNDSAKERISGTIFQAELDLTHPLGFGYCEATIPVFRRNTLFLKPSSDPYSTPLQYTDSPLLSGFVTEKNLKRIKNSAAILVYKLGNGRIIIFLDEVNFRGIWYGTNKLLLNSIFFGQIID